MYGISFRLVLWALAVLVVYALYRHLFTFAVEQLLFFFCDYTCEGLVKLVYGLFCVSAVHIVLN